MKIIFIGIIFLSTIVIILSSNNAYAPCPGGPEFNCGNYPESILFDRPQIIDLKVFPSEVKVGDKFSITATLVNYSTLPIVLEGGTCVPVIKHVPFFTVMLDNHAKIKTKNLTCAGVGLSEILNPEKSITGTSPDSTFTYVATKSGTANVTVTFSYRITNQTDLTQSNIEKTISKSILFAVQDNNTNAISSSMNHSYPATLAQSPLKQFKSGIRAQDVTCWQGLQLIFKFEDSSPACVKLQTAQTLVEHAWGMWVPAVTEQNIPNLSNSIMVPNTNFKINYDVTGNGKILDAKMDAQSKSLILSLETTSNGTLTLSIPRALLDIKKNDRGMGEFYMLTDGQETTFKEIHTTPTDRTFSIPFQNGTKNVEIIATELI